MSKKIAVDQKTELAMKRMGELISEIRGQRSLRKIAEPSGIPASQLQYIERGTMTPTSEVYGKLLDTLQPTKEQRTEMDRLFMTIRKTPPPDVCELIINNQNLIPILRAMVNGLSTQEQINELLATFVQEKIKGDTDNG